MNDPDHLTLDGCAHRLGLRPGRLHRAIRDGDFPDPVTPTIGEPRWRAADVLRWAAASSPDLAARISLRYWPDATGPAAYLGASEHSENTVLMTWQAGPGRVAVLWDTLDPIMVSLPAMSRRAGSGNVGPGFGIDGPELKAVNRATPNEIYALGWRELPRVLGQPVPYWPLTLRIAELICAWQPGAEPVTAPARPDLDTGVRSWLRIDRAGRHG